MIELDHSNFELLEDSADILSFVVRNRKMPFSVCYNLNDQKREIVRIIKSLQEFTHVRIVHFGKINKKPDLYLNGVKQLINFKQAPKLPIKLKPSKPKPWKKDRFYK